MRPRSLLAPFALTIGLFMFAGSASAQSDDAPSTGSAHAAHTAKPAGAQPKAKTKKPKTHTAKAKKATPRKKTPKPHTPKPHAHTHPQKA